MLARLLIAACVLVSGAAQAGYGWGGYCWDKLETAMGVHSAWYNTSAIGASILMYNPTIQRVYLLRGNDVVWVDSIYTCNAPSLGDYGTAPNNWYSPSGGVQVAGASGSGGSTTNPTTGSVELTEAQKTQLFNDGKELGWGLAGVALVAFLIRQIGRTASL